MTPAALRKRLAPVVQRAMKATGVPGVAVGIWMDDEPMTFGFGVTNIEFPLPVDGDTLFEIGSTTKTFTGTALMQLVDQGLVDLDAAVTTYLPEFRVVDAEASERATVRHLLTHTGGWLGDYFKDTGRGADALRSVVSRMAKAATQLTPLGEVWSYNNAGFYVAGRLIEKVTRRPYERVVTEGILNPLGMDRSFFFPEDVMTHKHALGHVRSAAGLKVARPFGLIRSANPAGGIVSTAADQLKYARFHLGDGTAADGTKVLSDTALKQMQQVMAPAGSLADHVGITWLLEDLGPARVVKHGGSVNGQMSAFALVPSRGFGITVLTNGDRGHEVDHAVTTWAFKELLGVERTTPRPRPLTNKAAAEYAGRYRLGSGDLVLTAADGEFRARVELDDEHRDDADLVAVLPPPFSVVLVGPDRAVVAGGSGDGRRVEFVREGGSVAWIRYGGRICRRRGADE